MPSPLYDRYLDFAPTFRWGGREWGAGDADLFRRKLGKRYGRWARNHPAAARVFDPVEQEIYGAYSPELRAIDRERQARQDYYGRLMRNLGGFAGALGPLLSGIPGQIQGVGNESANTMQAGGSGYGGLLNADQAAIAAASNQLLGDINSPAQMSGGDAGGVLAGYAGWIPSTMMREESAAWADRAKNFPKEAALQANLMMKDLLRGAAEDDAKFSDEITGVLSGMAGDRAKIKADYEGQRLERLKMDRDYALKQAALALSMGKQKDYQYWKRKAYELDMMQETRYRNKDKGLDADGNLLPGFRYNPKTGRIEKIPTKRARTKADFAAVRSDMSKDVEDFFTETETPNPTNSLLPPVKTKQPWTYKKAYDTLWAKYKGTMPANRLRRTINEILTAAGIKRGQGTGYSSPGPH